MADDASSGGFFSGINDTFAQLGKTYLNIEAIKAQTGALRSQAEYDALTNYNSTYTQNPNAMPLTAQQVAALRASSGLGISTPMLLMGGVAVLVLVLVLK